MNFNILMENNEPKLVCRKCQGPHLTIKCGKETKSVIENIIIESSNNDLKPVTYQKKSHNQFNKGDTDFKYEKSERFERKPLHKVKMSNLPVDINEEELHELLYDWGHVVRLRLLNYENNSTAYIEFKDKEPADYIVEALNKTPFEHIILDVERLYD
jgi:RNA recognition motif-containing protein